jgi:hypothetical protein
MPKLTLMLDRKTVQVYDIDRPVIRVGRVAEMDIVIDNVSVSRRQAEIERGGNGWVVRDIGSSNGTFVNGERLSGDRPLLPGDEIAIGKYSLFFERVLADDAGPGIAAPAARPAPAGHDAPGRSDATMFLRPEEVDQLRKSGAQKRQAHVLWEAAGKRGTHYLASEAAAALVGTDELCDLRVPRGTRHHLLLLRVGQSFEARNLSFWRKMKIGGRAVSRGAIATGDVIEIGGLKLTFMDEVR